MSAQPPLGGLPVLIYVGTNEGVFGFTVAANGALSAVAGEPARGRARCVPC
jgi:hypothetical protein